ncbi:MAG: PilZ domain-containing protein [Desulfobacteraceae bacterium]|nr:PilZ domain-containing protein [Desulfobacteraceae bacterium]
MKKGIEPKRFHERMYYTVDVIFAHRERAYQGTLKNLSTGGAFIKTNSANIFSKGDYITISIPYTTGKKHVKRNGTVKWRNNEGIAIEFN